MRKGLRPPQILDLTDIDAEFWAKNKIEQDIYEARNGNNAVTILEHGADIGHRPGFVDVPVSHG